MPSASRCRGGGGDRRPAPSSMRPRWRPSPISWSIRWRSSAASPASISTCRARWWRPPSGVIRGASPWSRRTADSCPTSSRCPIRRAAIPTEIRRGNERVIRRAPGGRGLLLPRRSQAQPGGPSPAARGHGVPGEAGHALEKTERLAELAGLAGRGRRRARSGRRRAARLAKTDLASGMVREFPELQGIIGEEVRAPGRGVPEVAQAIREHYLPRGADDGVPESPAGSALTWPTRWTRSSGASGSGSSRPDLRIRTGSGVRRMASSRSPSASASKSRCRRWWTGRWSCSRRGSRSPEERTRARAHELFRTRLAAALTSRGLRERCRGGGARRGGSTTPCRRCVGQKR